MDISFLQLPSHIYYIFIIHIQFSLINLFSFLQNFQNSVSVSCCRVRLLAGPRHRVSSELRVLDPLQVDVDVVPGAVHRGLQAPHRHLRNAVTARDGESFKRRLNEGSRRFPNHAEGPLLLGPFPG